MNYQQWQPLDHAPIGRTVAINASAFIFPGQFHFDQNDDLYAVGPYGKVYGWGEIQTWSWSDTEPEQEMLMVKPHGIFCAHWWNEIGHLLNIIQENNVKSFFELGVLDGGLTALMLSEIRFAALDRYRGFNLGLHHVNDGVLSVMEKLDSGNWASSEPAKLFDVDLWRPKTVQLIRWEIRDPDYPGKVFLYCDGGDKPREAHLYWPILRPGDLLGVHDYSDDPNSKGPEVYPDDVADIIASGKRLGQEALKDTRILLIEKV